MTRYSEPAPAKLNLALHVRGKLRDGRHRLETVFAFCTDGDVVEVEPADELTLTISGPFAEGLSADDDNLVLKTAKTLRDAVPAAGGAHLHLKKNLPLASGIGGGSADAAASLRVLTRLWKADPAHAVDVAPRLGSDVPACLLSMSARGDGAGDELTLFNDPTLAGTPVLLVNPMVPLSTAQVFARWDGLDRGLLGDWREGRNDLEAPARGLVPQIGDLLEWIRGHGANFARMSGSGATCFGLFDSEEARDQAAAAVPAHWWHLATFLR